MSIPYFHPSRSLSVNIEIYINECLQPGLLPYINKHHSHLNFQFLHDLAVAHFSMGTNALMSENLPFVNNTIHPQNVLQVWLIENLWAVLSQEIYEGASKATT